MSTVSRFPGGIHPHEGEGGKAVTATLPILEAPQPSRVVIPLNQHIGSVCKPLVSKGDLVKVGQMIGEPAGLMSAAVHSSVSGKVIGCQPCILANGTEAVSVIIDNDFKDEWVELKPITNPEKLTASELSELARQMGIVGLGGATFPTAVKIAVPADKKVNTLILNGVECEPYLSADHRLMIEYADKIVSGAKVVKRTLGIDKVLIGIENNKPDAIEIMKKACANVSGFEVVGLRVQYPQGGEKQLVYALTKKKVQAGKLPLDLGIIVMNVGTVHALNRAVYEGRPIVDRIVTVGGCVQKPANYSVRIGTTVEWLIDTSKGVLPETKMLIYGGPMMGVSISREDIPVTKGCSGILALDKLSALAKEGPCIRCGRCLEACPMQLAPATIDRYTRHHMIDEAEKCDALSCLECGACAWSCPARRNLTQSCRTAKYLIQKMQKERIALKGGN